MQSNSKRNRLIFGTLTAEFFFYHSFKLKNKPGYVEDSLEIIRPLLVCRKFCKAFFELPNSGCSLYSATNCVSFKISNGEFWAEASKATNLDFPANFLSLCQSVSVGIHAVSQESERRMFKSYAKFCRKVRESNSLKEIKLYIDTAWSKENRTFMDLLPDRIIELRGCNDGARLMGKRRTLNLIKLRVDDRYYPETNKDISIYYNPILEANVRQIKFEADIHSHSLVHGLDGMAYLYPMKPNKTLERVKIFARMITTIYEVKNAGEDYNNMQVDELWLEGRFEKYKSAFKALNSLNPNLELKVVDHQSYLLNLFTLDKVIEKIHLYLKNTELFCQAAVEANINLKEVTIGPDACLPTRGFLCREWKEACKNRIAEEFDLQFTDGLNGKYFSMNGRKFMHNIPVKIKLSVVQGNLNEGADDPYSGEWSDYKGSSEKDSFDNFIDFFDEL